MRDSPAAIGPCSSDKIHSLRRTLKTGVSDDKHTVMNSEETNSLPSETASHHNTGQLSSGGYGSLLASTRFEGFLWAQFLGAFNDNVYKMIVSFTAIRIAVDSAARGLYLAIAGAAFILPFILFSGYAGQLADRYSKTRVLQFTKSLEILTMAMGLIALINGNMNLLFVVLFLLGTQATFFSPAKYGILPEAVGEAQISRANGLLELTTFIAIVVGTSFGSALFEHWKTAPVRMGLTMLCIAIAGTLASLHIPRVPAAARPGKFNWNPFGEIVCGLRELRSRRPLALTILGISWFWFIGALFQLALVLEGNEILHVAETRAGLLFTALAIGIGIGSVVAGKISGDHVELGLVPAGSIIMGLFTILVAVTTDYYIALVSLAIVGFGGGFMAVPLNAYLQEKPAADEKGRMLATNNLMNSVAMAVAYGVLFVMHDLLRWNPRAIFGALGLMTLLGAVVVSRIMPAIAVRFILYCAANLMFRIKVTGKENIPSSGAALVVSNHISYADAVLAGYATRRFIRFLMWKPIYEVPAVRPFFDVLKAIPLDIGSPKATIRALKAAHEELLKGNLVGIFPEGQITRDGEIGPFERGYERVLKGIDCPIVPIRIQGLWGHPFSCKGGGAFRSWELWLRPTVSVTVGNPVDSATSPEELREIIMQLRYQTMPSAALDSDSARGEFVQ
jgi:acyl-[acyl-carrier-protein]-phospholipid O-acyltransferase/long-chain-fatty-acid--[acyl-carrier-protein] ligase